MKMNLTNFIDLIARVDFNMESAFDVIVIVLCFICSMLLVIVGYPFLGWLLGVYAILRIAYSFIKLEGDIL